MSLVDLETAKAACNVASTDTTKDDWFTDALNAATEVIESIVGPVLSDVRTYEA